MPRPSDLGIVALRLMIGLFFVFEGLEKVSWLMNAAPLTEALKRWAATAVPISRWYLEHVAIPGAPIFARLIFLGEVGAGIAFLTGRYTRLAAVLAFLMVLQIHFAHSTLFQYSFLSAGDGLPVLGCLAALALRKDTGGGGKPRGRKG